PIAALLFPITDFFTAQLLDLDAYPPLALEYSLRLSHFPAWPIPLYLFGLFCLTNSVFCDKIFRTYGDRSSVG
ncbi:MAG TPA: hypothetical protein VLF94_01200, partial [Chlamydiales bacterium]|nr:hypothetical protein [Chlamydiales bacterium]